MTRKRLDNGWSLRDAAGYSTMSVNTWRRIEGSQPHEYGSLVKAVISLGWPAEMADELLAVHGDESEPPTVTAHDHIPSPQDGYYALLEVRALAKRVEELEAQVERMRPRTAAELKAPIEERLRGVEWPELRAAEQGDDPGPRPAGTSRSGRPRVAQEEFEPEAP